MPGSTKKEEEMKKQVVTSTTHESSAQKGGVYILRIATILLAIVSWWATAQGMTNYVFSTRWQAYLASLAIQSILLGLNFYLPTFWRYTVSNFSKWGLAALSAVVLLCSSWFSYVFIVDHSYQESWDMISRLLVQSAYRQELYGALDYTEEYAEVLRETLGNQVSNLYGQAKEVEIGEFQAIEPIDLSQDRIDYADNPEYAANQEIAMAIQILENALREDASASDRDIAIEQISKLQEQVDKEINTLEADIARANAAIIDAEDRLRMAQNRWNNAPDDTDKTDLENAVDTANQNYRTQQSRALELENDLADYQYARRRLGQYLYQMNLSSSGAGTQVSASLRSIQSELLSGEIDTVNVEEGARQIFERLQASEDTLSADDTTYQTMLIVLDSFIRNVQKYAEVKESEQSLNALANNLQQESSSTNSGWKATWTGKLENLKSKIGGLPSYTGTDSQTLRKYDRTDAMDKLDNILRKYISNHNAADQALIYLFNPHCGLAIISILLAFFLDVSAFITGFIIDIVDQRQAKKILRGNLPGDTSEGEEIINVMPNDFASIPSTAQRYVFLTGDFTKEDDHYYYQALEGDEQIEMDMLGEKLQAGFHVEVDGQLRAVTPQELALLRMQNGPRDGIYQDCYLQYSDHMLSIKNDPNEEYHYLATLDDDVPVYQIRKNECVYQDVVDIPPQVWNIAILALNSKGTQVAAIYLM